LSRAVAGHFQDVEMVGEPVEQRVLAASRDRTARVWDLYGQRVVTASEDHTVRGSAASVLKEL
jgi:hypothetical protein